MSLSVDRLSYQESTTPKGNPYHECRAFRNGAIIAPIILSVSADGLSEFAIKGILEKHKIPVDKYKGLTFVGGIIADVLIFDGLGTLADKLITKHRMKKADKLAEKQRRLDTYQ